MDQLLGAACGAQHLGGAQRMVLRRGVLLPIKIVQQADKAPELDVVRIELLREVAQAPFHRLGVLDMERILVVLVEQLERLVAREPRLECRHARPPSRSKCYAALYGADDRNVSAPSLARRKKQAPTHHLIVGWEG